MSDLTPLEELALTVGVASPTLHEAMVRADQDPEADPELPLLWAIGAGKVLAAVLPVLPEQEARAVFALIESAVGDPRLHDVVTTGILETLAAAAATRRLDPALLAARLGPASRRHLDDLTLPG